MSRPTGLRPGTRWSIANYRHSGPTEKTTFRVSDCGEQHVRFELVGTHVEETLPLASLDQPDPPVRRLVYDPNWNRR